MSKPDICTVTDTAGALQAVIAVLVGKEVAITQASHEVSYKSRDDLQSFIDELTQARDKAFPVNEPSLEEQAQAAWLASGEDDGPHWTHWEIDVWKAGWIAGKS